ncbi:ImmA/IrrE family metallo-endopeptidase [Lactococcus lactis]|uniref:ImmA/IrrE family metallo-endopeptidase n=1 Tax=Lactococcus lactis TaxID=1358 RepID=UPI002657B4A5|nr:ImmA/IrrE family metallo-endopeptidase [Lactococcus lactis]WKF73622.1 ImmA/IrrE family metallo-endopeptidase [Lactococcus lactis]
MGTSEFNLVDRTVYHESYKRANHLLSEISSYRNKEIVDLNWKDAILFFEENFEDLDFCFFDDGTYEYRNFKNKGPKYPSILTNPDVKFLEEDTIRSFSGMTFPEDEHIAIMINQKPNKERVIFTTLHELVHSYFHVRDSQKMQYFALLEEKSEQNGKYSKEVQPLEDEANIIASILILNQERLEKYLLAGVTFEDIMFQVDMSEAALISRLKNYLYNILNVDEFKLSEIIYPFKNDDISIKKRIQRLITVKIEQQKEKSKYVTNSAGILVDKLTAKKDLSKMSIGELELLCEKIDHKSDLYLLAFTEKLRKEKFGEQPQNDGLIHISKIDDPF